MRYIVVFLFSLCCSFNAFAENISGVNLREKIGQMLLIGFYGGKVNNQSPIIQTMQKNNIGGVILFNYNKNIENPEQVKQLNQDLQYFNDQGHLQYQRAQLPLLISVDYEGGKVNRLGTQYGFPAAPSAAEVEQKSVAEVESIAESMASTLQTAGFNLNLAPVLDVNANPDNPVIGKMQRSFSADAAMVGQYASIYTHKFLNKNVQCAYKHFPGHGSSTKDSHLGFVDVTETWQPDELLPYQMLLSSNDACGVIMTAHIVNRQLDESGLPATLSYKILTELLRQQLNFKGVIVTDDMKMKAITDNYGLEESLVLTINAGADMVIFSEPQDPEKLIDIIESKALAGGIHMERINDAYQHIISLKESLKSSALS